MTASVLDDMYNKPQQKVKKPTPNVAAGTGGGIHVPEPMDVLSGRGGAVNSHVGNTRFREIVNLMKTEYLKPSTKKNQKTRIAASIVWAIRNNSSSPGRFLKQDPDSELWYEIGDKAAYRKTGQALRENSAEFIRSWEEGREVVAVDGPSHGIGVVAVIKHHEVVLPQQTCINPLRTSLCGLDAIAAAAIPI